MSLGPNRFAQFLEPSLSQAQPQHHVELPHALEFGMALLSVCVALTGIFLGVPDVYRESGRGRPACLPFSGALRAHPQQVLRGRDVRRSCGPPTLRISRDLLWKSLDVKVVDGAVNGAADWFAPGRGC